MISLHLEFNLLRAISLNMEARNELKYILSSTNDLLKYGEAKHVNFVVLNSVLIVGIITSYSNIHHLVYPPMILTGTIAFGLSIFTSIVSQFPITSNVFYSRQEIENPNIYFFRHLACLDHEKFIICYKQMDTAFIPTKFHTDLINQILVNARIAHSKFVYFRIACYLTVIGAGIIGVSTIIKIILK